MITASIVLYKPDAKLTENLISNVLKTSSDVKLFLIDNSPTYTSNELKSNGLVEYLHFPENPGFGAGHNIALGKALELGSKYHFIINPDISYHDDVITEMVHFMSNNTDVGMMMPKVLNIDGSIQFLPKLIPNLLWIIRRKLKKLDINHQSFIDSYELRGFPQDRIYEVPILSGCFSLLNMEAIKQLGGYDETFFMYFEDFDLSRRINKKYKTLYYPLVSVYHMYEGGANKSLRLFKIFLKSAVTYFNKWGWLVDYERILVNNKTWKQFGK